MAIQVVSHLNVNYNEIQNVRVQAVATLPNDAPDHTLVVYNHALYIKLNGDWVSLGRLDQISAPAAHVNINNKRLINVADPVSASDVATKNYVDSVAQGLRAKQSVRAATTSTLEITGRTATTLTVGGTSLSIDGVALNNADRVLIKNDTSGVAGAGSADNGIYEVSGIGSSVVLTRTDDANTWSELVSAFVFVEEGATNADSGWLCSVDQAGGTLGATEVTWVQFSQAGVIQAGTGLAKSGTTIFMADMAGLSVKGNPSSSSGAPTDIVAVTDGAVLRRSGASLAFGQVSSDGIADDAIVTAKIAPAAVTTAKIADGAVTNDKLAGMSANRIKGTTTAGSPQDLTPEEVRSVIGLRTYSVTGPPASASTWDITHNLGTRNVMVHVYMNSGSYDTVFCDVQRTNVNTVRLMFGSPQAGNSLVVMILAIP